MKYILILLLLTFNALGFDAFIKPIELKELQKSNNLVLLDVSSKSSYNKSHIPNALHVDINKFIKRKYTKRKFKLSNITKSHIKRLGIHENSKIVIYSRNNNKDLLSSSYLAMIFILHGFENVSLQDGGYMAWVFEYNLLVSTKSSKAAADGTFKIKPNKNILIRTSHLKKNLNTTLLIDSRESPKFYGQTESDNSKILGHIAYAKSHYYRDNFFDDFTIKSDEYLEKNFISKLDITKDKDIVIYGDTILTASMNWYILYKKLGFVRTKVYPELFSKWVEKKLPLTLYK